MAGVDSPERFSEHFPVNGWRPVDADIQISDVRRLTVALGGEQLYGRHSETGLRELIQNAQDAVLARRIVDPSAFEGRILVRLHREDSMWILEVRDDGIGMDEDILVNALLDFGISGWRTSMVRSKFAGLIGKGFRPRGQFGIGFFAVFMLGDQVEVTTRRYDLGKSDALRLTFSGRESRPLLVSVPADEHVQPGTTVRIILEVNPYDRNGVLYRTTDERLNELVQRLVPENAVPVHTSEMEESEMHVLLPLDLSSATAEDVFDRLYPRTISGGPIREEQRLQLRGEFALRATAMYAAEGERIGLAVIGHDLTYISGHRTPGVVIVSGFRADEHPFFTGYVLGKPNRASRDMADVEAKEDEFQAWLISQEARLRTLNVFDTSVQLENALTLYRARGGDLSPDYHMAMTANGVISSKELQSWANDRDEVFLSQGWPLMCNTRPPQVIAYPTGKEFQLPQGWILPCNHRYPFLDNVLSECRDSVYEDFRHDRDLTWQKVWWRLSGYLDGLIVREVCRAWGCEIGDVLAPVAARGWNDYIDTGIPNVNPLPVYHLCRPNAAGGS